jgi:hypothetical protein
MPGLSSRLTSFFIPRQASYTPETQVVRSQGIYHGLPTYPDGPSYRNLTALVTGATGVSGYNMVKVLAASGRWTKVYCTSSRPPPSNFFANLGGDAAKVEHLVIDFLDEPEQIARRLNARGKHLDHIFYFSYMQPVPKSDILNLLGDEGELKAKNIPWSDP